MKRGEQIQLKNVKKNYKKRSKNSFMFAKKRKIKLS